MHKDRLRARAHVVIPRDLLREVDALVGNRKRSDFFVEAAEEKLDRIRLREAAHEFAGALKDASTPHWETPEATLHWVHSLRRESDEQAFPRENAATLVTRNLDRFPMEDVTILSLR